MKRSCAQCVNPAIVEDWKRQGYFDSYVYNYLKGCEAPTLCPKSPRDPKPENLHTLSGRSLETRNTDRLQAAEHFRPGIPQAMAPKTAPKAKAAAAKATVCGKIRIWAVL